MDAANTGTGGLDSGFVTVISVSVFHYDGLCAYPALNADGVDTVDMPYGSDFLMVSATAVLKIPIITEMTINVVIVWDRTVWAAFDLGW